MVRTFSWAAAVLALSLMSLFTGAVARGDDAPSTQPSAAGSGSIAITVVDASNKPVEGVTLKLTAGKPKKAPTESAKKPKTLATGKTDAEGKFTFANIPTGKYRVTATLEGVGHGNSKVSVTDDAPNVTATITLKPYPAPTDGGNQPTTAPSPSISF
jgi:hypothetical protein